MKSEPSVYSIDDLKKANSPAMWEGCRNYTVRNFIRDSMSIGDLAFFYHSVCSPTGIAGIMEIVSDYYPDPTQFDPDSEYFDIKAPKDGSRWLVRNVKFVKKFSRIITLEDMRKYPDLCEMNVLKKGQRLSIMPVSEAEWHFINALPGL